MGSRISPAKTKDPAAEREELVRVLSNSIIKHLNRQGLRAEHLPNLSATYLPDQTNGLVQFLSGEGSLPKTGWLLTGWFEKVQESNPALEATAGFGAGVGHATADVVVSDLAQNPAQPFLVIGSGSRTKRTPGGLITMNPYVMNAKFVVHRRQGMAEDVKSLGREIASSLIQYVNQIAAQPPPPTSSR